MILVWRETERERDWGGEDSHFATDLVWGVANQEHSSIKGQHKSKSKGGLKCVATLCGNDALWLVKIVFEQSIKVLYFSVTMLKFY